MSTAENHKATLSKGPSLRRATRVAGFMFLFSFIVPTIIWAFGLSSMVVPDDIPATAERVMGNESLFRIGIAVELVMSAGLVLLAVSLYSLLKRVDPDLALLALMWKVIEATLSATIVLLSLIAILYATQSASSASFAPEQLRLPVGFLLHTHAVLFACPMVFLGLDMIIFFYLFFKSKYIPRTMASIGILSFVLILIHAVMHFVLPGFAKTQVAQVAFYTPSAITELVVGTWLLTKGIATHSSMPRESVDE